MVHGPDPRAEIHAHGEEAHDHHDLARVAAAVHGNARRRRLRTGALVALFTLAGATLTVELALRLTKARERELAHNVTTRNRRWVALTRAGIFQELDDPVRRYGMRAGAEATIDAFRFHVSAEGTRGPDLAVPKPAGEKRLLCLGDSFAFGLWCDDDETLVAELARLAEAREAELGSGVHWTGVDLGVPGYHLGQILRAFTAGDPRLEPDLVVLYFNTNDVEQSGFYFDEELGVLRRDFLPLPAALKSTLWHASHLYGWLASRHARAVEDGETPWLEPRVPWAHVRADNQRYTRAQLSSLADLCRARGLPLFVIHQPLMGFLGGARRADWPVLPLERWFRDLCTELGLPALHLLGWERGYADGVDRFESGAPPDFLPDQYIADESAQAALEAARAHARAEGKVWDELPFAEQLTHFAGVPALPADLDFHLTGAGYRHIARLAYARMRSEGLLP